jgi:D-tyrosyl-tRNA(Tyr) deacylase
VEAFGQALRGAGVPAQTGRFGAKMDVELVNDGPVTIILDSADLVRPRRGQAPSRALPEGESRNN